MAHVTDCPPGHDGGALPHDCELRLAMGYTFKLYNLRCCYCANKARGSGELHFDMTPVDANLWPFAGVG